MFNALVKGSTRGFVIGFLVGIVVYVLMGIITGYFPPVMTIFNALVTGLMGAGVGFVLALLKNFGTTPEAAEKSHSPPPSPRKTVHQEIEDRTDAKQ